MTNEQNEKDDASEAVRATDHGFLCDSPCTRFHINGECYCIEEMRKGVADLDDAVISTLEAQGWKGLRAKLLAERD
jgi:hypothetical protein